LHIEHAKGSVSHPLTDTDIEDKFHALSARHLDRDQALRLIDNIWNVERMDNVAQLMKDAAIPYSC